MSLNLRCAACVLLPVAVLFCCEARASDAELSLGPQDYFHRGSFELNVDTAMLYSPVVATQGRQHVNYTLSQGQLGYMLSSPGGPGFLRGNFELFASGFGGAIVHGEGSYVAGGTVWLRYNFVPRGWRLTPYLQGGAGLTSTDVDRRLLGQNFNFNLDLGAGVRFMLSRHWAVNAELRYQHISNADMSNHNFGINALGPAAGVSCFF